MLTDDGTEILGNEVSGLLAIKNPGQVKCERFMVIISDLKDTYFSQLMDIISLETVPKR